MKKLMGCVCVCVLLAFKPVSADETNNSNNEIRVEHFISTVYNEIDFSKCRSLSYDAFEKAYKGYLNLKNAGKLNSNKDILSICDFSLSSTENRLWIIDLSQRKVLFNTYVAHGQGSGDEYAEDFSNDFNSHQSSLGFYVTGDTYDGDHGTSLHLTGMDNGFNDAAYDRGIVVHGAEYVCDKFISANQKLGRSWGCPAVPAKLSLPIINTIKDGTCLFIYYPDKKYLKSAFWLNKKITDLPEDDIYAAVMPATKATQCQRATTIEYITNGKIDSVKVIPLTTEAQ